MKLPVILLNYNSTEDCSKCISYLQRQEGVELEIIVVDNCSAPDNREAVEVICREYGCTFIPNDRNAGYNAGNNIGLRYAASKGYEYTLISNPDMEFPQKDTIMNMVRSMEKDGSVAASGTDVVTKEGIHQNPRKYGQQRWQSSFRWISDFFRPSAINANNQTPDWVDSPAESHYCSGLNGCCLLVRMSFMKELGYFDERVFLYGEESIFAFQVKKAGKKMYYDAGLQVIHDHKKSMEGNPRMVQKHWRHSRLHAIKFYSDYPWYGKLFARASIYLYFLLLSVKTPRR